MRKEFERHLKTYKIHYLNTESTLRTQQHKNLIKRKVFHQNEDIQMTRQVHEKMFNMASHLFMANENFRE